MKKTIYEVASELNVAPSTISKALNGSPGVSDKLRKKILDYAKEVNYFANPIASNLKSKKSYSIGIVFTEHLKIGLQHQFFSSIIQHFKDYVESKGYEITFVITNLGNAKTSYLEFCTQKKIEGVFIVTSSENDNNIKELVNSNIKCVTTDNVGDKLHTIISDNHKGAKLAVDYFHSIGIKRIAHIKGPNYSIAAKERELGFCQTQESHGIKVEDELLIEVAQFSFEHGYQAGREFLKLDNYPEAAFVCSDIIAMGFIRCLNESGVRVPEDVKVIGFDDIEFSRLFTPSLTTIRQNVENIGKTAARKLLTLIQNKDENIQEVERIPVELVLRDSTKT